LVPQTKPFVYGPPLCQEKDLPKSIQILEIQETKWSRKQQRLVVKDLDSNKSFGTMLQRTVVEGRVWPMTIWDSRICLATGNKDGRDHTVLRGVGNGARIGVIQFDISEDGKCVFKFFGESSSADAPDYGLQGDVQTRTFRMRSENGDCVAKFWRNRKKPNQNHQSDNYIVKIAPNMETGLVLTCICVIDLELDAMERCNDATKDEHRG